MIMFVSIFLSAVLVAICLVVVLTCRRKKLHWESKNWNPTSKEFQHYWKRSIKVLKWRAVWEYFRTPTAKWPKSILAEYSSITRGVTDRIANIGHATFLIQMDGCNILTDPVFSNRAGPLGVFGPKRIVPPGISIQGLPPIDVVFISHNHYDHLDAKSVKLLARMHNVTFVVPLGVKKKLDSWKLNRKIIELDWWQSCDVKGVCVSSMPAQHWSRRGVFDMNKTLWMGGMFMSKKHKIFFAGDTGWGPHFADIAEKYSDIDVSLLPIGAYKPHLVMQVQHMGPKDALNACIALKSKKMVPIHYDVFNLGKERYQEAEQDLLESAIELSISDEAISILKVGQQLEF